MWQTPYNKVNKIFSFIILIKYQNYKNNTENILRMNNKCNEDWIEKNK